MKAVIPNGKPCQSHAGSCISNCTDSCAWTYVVWKAVSLAISKRTDLCGTSVELVFFLTVDLSVVMSPGKLHVGWLPMVVLASIRSAHVI